ncbi:MAG: hypothetical protein J5760_04430 [Clostridia bacterium]|nr:hypothetical protein [Clostridia bacterium]
MKLEKELTGAWEERGVIGTRLEFKKNELTVLWRNTPVLVTKFKVKETEDGYELELKKNGLAYPDSAKEYASVTRVCYRKGRLLFEELFPISGPSKATLDKTEYSRYGNYTVRDEVLKELQGKWVDTNRHFDLEFKGDTLFLDGRNIKVHVLHANYESTPENLFIIADADPSNYELFFMSRLEYNGDVLQSHLLVCDAPSVQLTFRREK